MKTISKLIFSCACFLFSFNSFAQCDTTVISGNFIHTSDQFLSGTYIVSGTFEIRPNVTIYVQPYSFGGCGSLEIIADKIIISGTINGDFAGHEGGTGGTGGLLITSLTGDITALDNCSNKDNSGQVTVEGGQGGINGSGAGAGNSGADGTNGSGPKQQCGNNGDDAGMIGSGGGAGGGGGGSYGGTGNAGASGGDGTNNFVANGINISVAYTVLMGQGGAGGSAGTVYGSQYGMDIDLGSGGAGAGGGGRSYSSGLNGNRGGAGGGMVKLTASDSLIIASTAVISVKGEDGFNGGNGGSGGVSPLCCSDGCDDCGEGTLSCGSGGGSGAGGGSGGGILIIANGPVSVQGNLNAQGGDGGTYGLKGTGSSCIYAGNLFCSANDITSGDGVNGSNGGGGGGGRIKVFAVQDCGSVTAVMNSGGGTGYLGTAASGTAEIICTTQISETENQTITEMKVYPNPVSEMLIVEYTTAASASDVRVIITDLSGRIISETNAPAGNNRSFVNTETLAPGIYFCTVEADGLTKTEKFIRQ